MMRDATDEVMATIKAELLETGDRLATAARASTLAYVDAVGLGNDLLELGVRLWCGAYGVERAAWMLRRMGDYIELKDTEGSA
jgi:hypothetical protein